MTRTEILTDVMFERARQWQRWNDPHDWGQGDCSSHNVPQIVKAAGVG